MTDRMAFEAAQELTERLAFLAELNRNPRDNAALIKLHQAEVRTLTAMLSGYALDLCTDDELFAVEVAA